VRWALHFIVMSPLLGAIQNQHTRMSGPLTKDSKPSRDEDEGEDLEKTGESVGQLPEALSCT
jgi:hypothetical protein